MQDNYDIRRKQLLLIDVENLKNFYHQDELSLNICKEQKFWRHKYKLEGVKLPRTILPDPVANILYTRAVRMLKLVTSGTKMITQQIKFAIQFTEENRDIGKIIQDIMSSGSSNNIILTCYKKIYYIAAGPIFGSGDKLILSSKVSNSLMLKFIQFLLLLEVKIWFIKNEQFLGKEGASSRLKIAAEFTYTQ